MQINDLGRQPYLPIFHAMQSFTAQRTTDTEDELWLVEHEPVFTQGLNGQPEHLLQVGDIPVVQTDRGGQVTYHGPGQIVLYCLFDLKRLGVGIRAMVSVLEASVIHLLAGHEITAYARADAPGVYVDGAKVAALGLRVKHGNCYHGLSLNVDMDLLPFQRINPCGYADMPVIDLKQLGIKLSLSDVKAGLLEHFQAQLTKALNDNKLS